MSMTKVGDREIRSGPGGGYIGPSEPLDIDLLAALGRAAPPAVDELRERYDAAWTTNGRGRPAGKPAFSNVQHGFQARLMRAAGISDSEIVAWRDPNKKPPATSDPAEQRRAARKAVDRWEAAAAALERAEGLAGTCSPRDEGPRRTATFAHRRWHESREDLVDEYRRLLSESTRCPADTTGRPQVRVESAIRCLRAEITVLRLFEAWRRAEDAVSPPVDRVGNRASYRQIEAERAECVRLAEGLELARRDSSATAARRKFTTSASLAALDQRDAERDAAYLGHTPVAQRDEMAAVLAELDAEDKAVARRDVLGRLTMGESAIDAFR